LKASEIRQELIREHAEIRVMMEVTLTIAKGARAGSPGGDIHGCLVRLAKALRRHNLREQALLRDLISSVDAWGPVRAEIMTQGHIEEHARIDAALLGIPFTPVEFAASGIAALIDVIREHMDREETAFLNEDVLRDDIVVTNQSGG